jgi:hypothetical protein
VVLEAIINGLDYKSSNRPRIEGLGGDDSVLRNGNRERKGRRQLEEWEVRVGVALLYGEAHCDY